MRISDWSSDVCSSDLGRFETRGLGRERKLVEALNDGSSVEYGHVRFALGDPRSSGTWRSPDGSVALLGTRYYDVPRYGLVRVTSDRKSVCTGEGVYVRVVRGGCRIINKKNT